MAGKTAGKTGTVTKVSNRKPARRTDPGDNSAYWLIGGIALSPFIFFLIVFLIMLAVIIGFSIYFYNKDDDFDRPSFV